MSVGAASDDEAGDLPSHLVVIGASAGGVEALRELVAGLPGDLSACVLVVLHVPATGGSALPSILDRAGPLPARHAVDGERLGRGQVLVAQPDHHLLVLGGHVALTRGPQENGHRPAVDVLFRSAARAWGARVTSVVLSGSLDDGAAGSIAVHARGGRCLVQDPDDALYDAMPVAALKAVPEAERLGVGALITRVVELDASAPPAPPHGAAAGHHEHPTWIDTETLMADLDPAAMHDPHRPGDPSGFGCPDCAGSLFVLDDGPLRRFRCRVGHAWSPESLLERQGAALEGALWMALRALEEKAALQSQLRDRALAGGSAQSAERFGRGQEEAHHAAELVRRLVAQVGQSGVGATGGYGTGPTPVSEVTP